jgi:hypothetical protein
MAARQYADGTTEPRRGDLIVGQLPDGGPGVAGIVLEVSPGNAERGLKVAYLYAVDPKKGRLALNLGRWTFRGYEPGEITVEANTTYLRAEECGLLYRPGAGAEPKA